MKEKCRNPGGSGGVTFVFFHVCDSDKTILESRMRDSTFHHDSATIDNMSEPTDEDWKRLGARLTRQRLELGYDTRPKFVEAKGLKHGRIVADLETGARSNYDAGTLIQYELKYEWGPGSIESVLAGGEPTLMKDLARDLGHRVPTRDDGGFESFSRGMAAAEQDDYRAAITAITQLLALSSGAGWTEDGFHYMAHAHALLGRLFLRIQLSLFPDEEEAPVPRVEVPSGEYVIPEEDDDLTEQHDVRDVPRPTVDPEAESEQQTAPSRPASRRRAASGDGSASSAPRKKSSGRGGS